VPVEVRSPARATRANEATKTTRQASPSQVSPAPTTAPIQSSWIAATPAGVGCFLAACESCGVVVSARDLISSTAATAQPGHHRLARRLCLGADVSSAIRSVATENKLRRS